MRSPRERAWMRLADARGQPLREVKAKTPEREFRQWAAYYAREPSVGDRIDELMAVLVSAVVNAAPFRTGRPADPNRLLPRRWGQPMARPDRATLAEKLLAWGRAMATVTKEKG